MRLNGGHVATGALHEGEVYVAVDDLRTALSPADETRAALRASGDRLYAAVPWSSSGGSITVQREGLPSARVVSFDGKTFVPLTDLRRAFSVSLKADVADCVYDLRASDCAACLLAATHWYYAG